MDIIVKKVKSNLNKLLLENKSILIALSGGKDSITLLHILLLLKNELNLKISIAYINHNLRGKESIEEEKFVSKIIARLKLPLYKLNIREECWKEVKNESIEMAARRLRYNFFKQVVKENNIDFIATAHNFNDKIETFFLQMFRGGGIDTLKSIPSNCKNIIRPLINITRNEIDEFIIKYNLPYVEDSSNSQNIYKRNIIRNKLLPIFKEIHPNYEKSFNHIFNFVDEEQKFINYLARKNYKKILIYSSIDKICINKKLYFNIPGVIQKTILKIILREMNYPVKQSVFMLDYLSGKKDKYKYKKSDFYCSSNNDYIIFINISKLKILKKDIIVDKLPFQYNDEKFIIKVDNTIVKDPKKSFNFRFAKDSFPIKIRHLKEDDCIYISNNIKKNIYKILRNLKTPLPLFKEVIVIESDDNQIIGFYLNNYFRVSERFYIIDFHKENVVIGIGYYK